MKVNVIYLTNKCNLKCPYCYEKQGQIKRRKNIITTQEIDNTLYEILENEPNLTSTICLMGGEPFLEFDKILYTFNKCKEIKSKYKKGYSINVVSNGTLIHNYINELKYMDQDKEIYFSLDVSYDGKFQYIRTKKSKIVEKNLLKLKDNNISFGISYTVSSQNHEKKFLLKEIISILEKYYKNNCTCKTGKIRINFDRTGIESVYPDYDGYIKNLKDSLSYLYTLYKIPLCHIVCNICKRCKKSLFNGISYSVPGKSEKILQAMKINQPFKHFEGDEENV